MFECVYAIGEASRIDREIWLVTCEYHSASMLRTSPHVLHPARHRAVLVTKRTSVNLFITNRTIVTIVKQREAQAYLGVHSQLKMGTVTHPDPPAPAGAAFAGASNAAVPSQYRAGRARRVEVHQLSLLRVTVPVSWAVAASAAWTMTSRDASFGAQRPEHEHLSLFGATHCCLALDHCEP